MFQLREDQLADVTRVLSEPTKAALIATTVGGGKTATAIEVVRQVQPKIVLAIVPPNTYRGWKRHVKMLLGTDIRLISNKRKDERQNVLRLREGEPGFYMMSWEFARQFDLTGPEIDFVIGDEVHRAQNRKSNSFAMFSDLCKAVERRGGWRLALSATPYGNRPAGAFGVAHSLWPERYHHFWPFVEEFIGKQFNQWAGTVEPKDRERVPGAIAQSMACYIRHQPGIQCCAHHPHGLQHSLPKRVVHQVDVELSMQQRNVYKQLEQDNFVWLEGAPNPLTTQGFPIVLSGRLRQICLAVPSTETATKMKNGVPEDYTKVWFPIDTKSTKIDAVLDILADLPDGERVLILSHSAGIGEAIAHRINKAKLGPAHVWNGSVSASKRNDIFNAFVYGTSVPEGSLNPVAEPMRPDYLEDDDCRVIVAQVGAIGEGVDGLQWVCSSEIWFSMDTNNLLNIQAAGRLDRDGQTRPVNSWSLEATDTVEQNQLESLAFQNAVMSGALRPVQS